ncbi:hypothetical protein [Longispora fulva]|uniref:AMP-binding enzyme n=1 Tax=Longispora fulva TaxID=619741 RepID=A0A8J7GBS8_9ACTN|nr:hypothetical protein [Longispora fulva]MBG6137598.1 hypothetical protein [Longispora fulva]
MRHGDHVLTYAELDAAARSQARNYGFGSGTVVAVARPCGVRDLAIVLAVARAGGEVLGPVSPEGSGWGFDPGVADVLRRLAGGQ